MCRQTKFCFYFKCATTFSIFTLVLTLSAFGEVPIFGHWTFDNATQLGEDTSGNGLDGTLVGATATSGRPLIGGGNSGAIALDGNDYVQIPNAPSINASQILTVEAWVRDRARQARLIWPKASPSCWARRSPSKVRRRLPPSTWNRRRPSQSSRFLT